MGMHPNVRPGRWPRQTNHSGRSCRVLFRYGADGERAIAGKVLRDDAEAPLETIIMLVDGRVVRGAECQWSPVAETSVTAELAREITRVAAFRDRWRDVSTERPEVASIVTLMTASIIKAEAASASGDIAAAMAAYAELKGYESDE